MKMTVDLPESLLQRARRVAEREKTTLRALVEETLRRILAEREGRRRTTVRLVTFGGEGLQPELEGAAWSEILDRSYGSGAPRSRSTATS